MQTNRFAIVLKGAVLRQDVLLRCLPVLESDDNSGTLRAVQVLKQVRIVSLRNTIFLQTLS